MIGTVLGNRYKLIAELGSGGMAWVYLAQDLREDQAVAVKILYPQHSQDLGFLRRFMQEAKLAMSLGQDEEQRQIVRVLDYGSDRDTHYLVMEFVQGQDLGQILEEQGAMPWPEALRIAHQVTLALRQAHQNHIVHRDIKPGNIMLTSDGAVRVLDFGIARARTSPDLTLSGFVGSPNYAAPEQAMGERVDIRADIYSLGVVMYKMLSGRLPFEANTPWAVVNQHIASPPPPLQETCPDLPDPVVHLVERAMAKRAEDRFQTPGEMAEAIATVLAGHTFSSEMAPIRSASSQQDPDELYHQAQQAIQAENWQEAIDLLSQIVRLDPDYRDATEQLTAIGEQIRIETLYRSAQQALQLGHWNQALAQLDRITEIDPEYQDTHELRRRAENEEHLEPGDQDRVSDFPTQVEVDPPELTLLPEADQPDRERVGSLHPPGSGQRRRLLWVLVLALVLLVAAGAVFLLRAPGSPASIASTTVTPSATNGSSADVRTSATILPPTTDTRSARKPTLSPTSTTAPSSLTTVPTPGASITLTVVPTRTATPSPRPTRGTSLAGQIAFPRFDTGRSTYDVYVCRVDGTNCRRVAAEASQPDFLPGGNQIVVHSWKPDDKGLLLQSLSGQRIWKISNLIEAARPSVDFQGQIYAYQSREESDRQSRLYRTYDAESRPIKREGNVVLGQSPSWLPDGRILYSGCLQDTCGIIVMRADGSNPRQVTAGSTETNPEASPDGQRIAFMSQRDGNWEVYVVNVDGSGLQTLTRNPANDGLPSWSPDGQHIAFVSDRDGGWAIWALRADGGELRKLFEIGGPLDGQVRGTAPHEIYGWVEERISWAALP